MRTGNSEALCVSAIHSVLRAAAKHACAAQGLQTARLRNVNINEHAEQGRVLAARRFLG